MDDRLEPGGLVPWVAEAAVSPLRDYSANGAARVVVHGTGLRGPTYMVGCAVEGPAHSGCHLLLSAGVLPH